MGEEARDVRGSFGLVWIRVIWKGIMEEDKGKKKRNCMSVY